jgi:hypothetical protein
MRAFAVLIVALVALVSNARAGFHVMQIEQVIGGLNGNPAAQSIQLRLRGAGQNQVQAASLWASDANGANRILLLDITTPVSNSAAGARILFATTAFDNAMVAGGATTFVPDYVLANAIPAAYLNAGRLTFEQDGGTSTTPGFIYWSLAWGGAAYTGSNTNSDGTNGTAGAPFASALPTGPFKGIQFQGSASAASTSNATDYALTANPATVTRNNGTAFTVVPEPGSGALMAGGALALVGFAVARRRAARKAS